MLTIDFGGQMNGAGGARNRANSLSSNGSGSSSSGSSSPPEEACVSAAVAGPGGHVSAGHGSANGAGGPGHGSASGAGGPGTGHAGSSAARGGGGGASAAAPASVGHAVASLLLKRRHLNQRAACDALDRERYTPHTRPLLFIDFLVAIVFCLTISLGFVAVFPLIIVIAP